MTGKARTDDRPSYRRCSECMEIVPYKVKICPVCKSYQDWRRYASIGQTNLALLVALISVMTAAIPVFKEYLISQNSALSFVFQGIVEDRIGFLASNSGTRPGSVNRASFVVMKSWNTRDVKSASLAVAVLNQPRLVEPGKALFVEFVFRSTQSLIVVTPDAWCAFQIGSTDFKGASHTDQVLIPRCDDFVTMFGH